MWQKAQVVKGKGIARGLNYPTANLKTKAPLRLPLGSYVARGRVNGKEYGGVLYLGKTQEGGLKDPELHLFNFDDDLYGQTIEFIIGKFIMPHADFSDDQKLRTYVAKNVALAKRALGFDDSVKKC